MTTRTKILAIAFGVVLFFGAIVTDVANLNNVIYGVLTIGLEIATGVSLMVDAAIEA